MKYLILLLICAYGNIASLYSQVCDPAPSHISASGSTTFCEGGIVLLTSTTGGGIWYKNGTMISPIPTSDYRAQAAGYYNVLVEFSPNCKSDTNGTGVVVTVTPKPKSNITASGSTSFCEGDHVTLSSSSSSGNQWYKNGQPIGDGGQSYLATSSGVYNVIYYISVGCESDSTGEGKTISIQPRPMSKITAKGPTRICSGGSVTLESSSASGNQWTKDGAYIAGASAQDLIVSSSGWYNLLVNDGTCISDSTGKGIKVNIDNVQKPSVSHIGDSLLSSRANKYQWNFNGVAIKDAVKASLFIDKSGGYSVTIEDGAGCTNTSDIIHVNVTGVSLAQKVNLRIYPNPVMEDLFISSSSELKLKILNYTSVLMLESEVNAGETSIDFSALQKGLYLLVIEKGNEFFSQKIEKK